MSIHEIARSHNSCRVEAKDHHLVSQIWFKTEPLDHTFIYRAVQLQLQTDSSDQGPETASMLPGSWSWFELVVLKDKKATEPHVKDGRPLFWRSHGNRTDPLDQKESIDRHFGVVFSRKEGLLDALEVGNVIAVRVCAKYAGWVNDAREGRLIAKILDEDTFTPMSWTLNSKEARVDLPTSVDNGIYTLTPSKGCHVKSTGLPQVNHIWFTTPVLTEDLIAKIQDLQLFTCANHVGAPTEDASIARSWCWFDVIIMESPDVTEPKVQEGRSLVWRSHRIPLSATKPEEQAGNLFGPEHEIFACLAVGNVIAIRACAQFEGWELDGHSARMVIRVANLGSRKVAIKSEVDWKAVKDSNQLLQQKLAEYLAEMSGDSFAPVTVEDSISDEFRSDESYGAGGDGLRLLSLDGGGVRGISSLHILKAIMQKVPGNSAAKPCDYFDMMAGTSTGGLIVLMLGRLEMTIDDCIREFQRLSSQIFHSTNGTLKKLWTGTWYSATVLEQAIKDIVKKYTRNITPNPQPAPMQDRIRKKCKVFVCTMRADNVSLPATRLRTYINPNVVDPFSDIKIFEAGRATSAAPTYFSRITLNGVEFVDGGVGFNNPIPILMIEAKSYFGPARLINCIVTIGTGLPPPSALSSDGILGLVGTVMSMFKMATDSERAHLTFQDLAPFGSYYRFNTPTKVQINLAEYKRMDDLVNETQGYIRDERDRIREVAGKLPPKHEEA